MSEEIIEKIRSGNSISDQELKVAIEFYKNLESSLTILGKTYHLAWKDVRHELIRLEGYASSRGLK